MTEYEAGCLVQSLAGHDRGGLFIIIREDGDYVYLADGRTRSVSKPKRKKKKHVQLSSRRDPELSQRLAQGMSVRDEEIRYFMRRVQQGGNEDVESRCD
mgnify:FL=1